MYEKGNKGKKTHSKCVRINKRIEHQKTIDLQYPVYNTVKPHDSKKKRTETKTTTNETIIILKIGPIR